MLSCLLLIAGTQPSWAIFTVKSNGVVTTLATGSLTLGTTAGVVVDFQGNVYVTDRTNSQVVEFPSNGGAPSVLSITGLSPSLDAPSGLAIDSSGNLYIADTGNNRIVKVTNTGSGSVISTPTITLNAPQGVAVDISGNVYISNTGSNQIVEVPSGGGNASADLTGSLANPRGIAVDPLGNLYVADTGNSRVIKVNATSPFSSGSINATVTTAAGVVLDGPNGVFIGNNGVLYIADTDTIEDGHSTPGRVVIVDSQGNASELLTGYPVFDSPLATVTLSSGQAIYTTSALAAGTHSITAAYSGNAVFNGSTSAPVAELVQDFTVSTPTSGTTNTPSATVAPGGTATYTLNIGPSVGTVFPAPVTLSLSGLPPGATGTLSPSTLPAGASVTAVTLSIQLPQTTGLLRRSFGWVTPALALIRLPFAGRMRRSGRTLHKYGLILLLLLAGAGSAAGIMGCGAKDSGYFGQAQQTYHVVITATSGSVSHSTSVNLTVQ
jgi:DNA-binding beta-propeller fold protein YncE